MKNQVMYFIAAVGMLCLTIGFFIAQSGPFLLRNILFLAGGILLFYFHIVSVIRVARNKELGDFKRIFWFTLAVCLPVFGGVLYLVSYRHLENKKGI